MRILIIRYSSIGDILLTTPLIRTIRKKYPHAEIHFLTKIGMKEVLSANPHIDVFHYYENDLQKVVLELVPLRFDLVFDLHKNFRSRYVTALLKQAFNSQVQLFRFSKINIRKWLAVQLKYRSALPDKSIVDRYFEGVQTLDIRNDGEGLDCFIPADCEIQKDDLPLGHVMGFIACGIGGQHETKKMPVEKWHELISQLSLPVVLLGGPEDACMAEKLTAMDPVKIYNACGKFRLMESADIVRRSRLVITHDTGMMHMAAAFKKPIVSILGNTIPAFGMFPYYGQNNIHQHPSPLSIMHEVKGLSCRPCSKIGFKSCPKKHFRCMQDQNIDAIVRDVNALLQKK